MYWSSSPNLASGQENLSLFFTKYSTGCWVIERRAMSSSGRSLIPVWMKSWVSRHSYLWKPLRARVRHARLQKLTSLQVGHGSGAVVYRRQTRLKHLLKYHFSYFYF